MNWEPPPNINCPSSFSSGTTKALAPIHDNMVNFGIQPNAVTLRNPDFQMLAKAYGCHAEKPASLKALTAAIKAALNADGPTFIEMTPAMVNG